MHRWTPRTGIPAKTVKICDKIGGISARIGRTFKETVAIVGRTTERCEQTVRICGRTNMLEPARDNSNRTGNRCGTTVTIFRAIVGISEEIDRIGIRIGRTCAPTGNIKEHTGRGSVAGINNGQATVDRARIAVRNL